MAKSNRLYCAVFECLNSSITHPDITFFKLPGNSERRLKWLHLICRNDLESKPNFAAYRICEKHFTVEDIRQSVNRKLLKKNALPSLMLPSLPSAVPGGSRKEDKETQTTLSTETCTQTEKATKESYAQTPISLSYNTPITRKLRAELVECRKKIKRHESKNKSRKAEKIAFHQLCDKFLNDKLALLIKAQSNLKQHGKGNRYDHNYILFCLNLYCISPEAYQFLQSALCLPCLSTLYKHTFPTTTDTNEGDMSALKMKVAKMAEVANIFSVMVQNND